MNVAGEGVTLSSVADETAEVCPPHHWDIGRPANIETWTCTRCHIQRTVDRKALQNERVPFTMGGRRKPDSVPPSDTDLPPELH